MFTLCVRQFQTLPPSFPKLMSISSMQSASSLLHQPFNSDFYSFQHGPRQKENQVIKKCLGLMLPYWHALCFNKVTLQILVLVAIHVVLPFVGGCISTSLHLTSLWAQCFCGCLLAAAVSSLLSALQTKGYSSEMQRQWMPRQWSAKSDVICCHYERLNDAYERVGARAHCTSKNG